MSHSAAIAGGERNHGWHARLRGRVCGGAPERCPGLLLHLDDVAVEHADIRVADGGRYAAVGDGKVAVKIGPGPWDPGAR